MIQKATEADWDAYYRMHDQRSDMQRGVYERQLRRRERWERVIFVAFGAYLVLTVVGFATLL